MSAAEATPGIRPRVRIGTPRAAPPPAGAVRGPGAGREVVFDVRNLSVSYAGKVALAGVDLEIYRNLVTAVIGPSGCGKSTFLRSLNRMNDSVPGIEIGGQILYHGHDLHGSGVDRVEVRRRIGMVFQ
ncbi:MAG TPA: ATP-binding cassette domain-containing protein, partial [Solirubrobacteraceae bacterium]|nr:ATP-binding cassette domain-containing protein [Solirubrobacteraceae bacterium]